MATLLKIRGLDRANAVSRSVEQQVTAKQGFRVPSGVLTNSPGGVSATLTSGTSNAAFTVTASQPGASANGITLVVATPAGGTSTVVVTAAANTGLPIITVNPATGATAAQVVALINADPAASSLVTASLGASTGATAVAAMTSTALATGADSSFGNQPLFTVTNNKTTVVVNVDDPKTARVLRRNAGRYVSLGQP